MSVEEKLIRLAPPAFESLQEHPERLIDLIEDLYSLDYFDSGEEVDNVAQQKRNMARR